MKHTFRWTQYVAGSGIALYLMFHIHGGWPYGILTPSTVFLLAMAILMVVKTELPCFALGAATCAAYGVFLAGACWWWIHFTSLAGFGACIAVALVIAAELSEALIQRTDPRSSDQFAPLR